MPELYDIHDVRHRGKTPLCDRIARREYGPFEPVYTSGTYTVLKVS